MVIPIAESGLESQATLEDADTFAAVVAGATHEVTGTGWNRNTLTDVELATVADLAPDDYLNFHDALFPRLT
jgi:hypothetical protein